MSPDPTPLLSVRDLRLATADHELVHGVGFDVHRGQALGIVGESGSGKSLTCRAILGILPRGVEVATGSVRFDGAELIGRRDRDWRGLRGIRISAVFQDPASYLNPSIRVGAQLAETLRVTLRLGRRAARERSLELLASVGLHDPLAVSRQYPFELSGGMLQRVLIAISVSASPELLIADEATTALDVTVQAEVLDLLEDLRRDLGLTLILVSHDLAVVSQVCDDVVVMRDGSIVEAGPAPELLSRPRHEYTRSLIENHREYGIEKFLGTEAIDA
ncbi:ABC transporter ATP-binding protein [Microbacterium sp. 18062]|uniref:ABC transporter ATP-binding protein n=1 Tax=Microbacterium sp. 18062 TaxID=2681410 RepID=UPI00135B02B8|nr:ABC transporter ATP-binding protein [Microbacterium sp. 18062]